MNEQRKNMTKAFPGPAKQPVLKSHSGLAQQVSPRISLSLSAMWEVIRPHVLKHAHLHVSHSLPRTCRCGTGGVLPRASYPVHSVHEVGGRYMYSSHEQGVSWCCRKRVTGTQVVDLRALWLQ